MKKTPLNKTLVVGKEIAYHFFNIFVIPLVIGLSLIGLYHILYMNTYCEVWERPSYVNSFLNTDIVNYTPEYNYTIPMYKIDSYLNVSYDYYGISKKIMLDGKTNVKCYTKWIKKR